MLRQPRCYHQIPLLFNLSLSAGFVRNHCLVFWGICMESCILQIHEQVRDEIWEHTFWTTGGSRGPWLPGPPSPKIFSKSCSFQAVLGSGPPWGQNSAGSPWPKSWIRPCERTPKEKKQVRFWNLRAIHFFHHPCPGKAFIKQRGWLFFLFSLQIIPPETSMLW